MLELYHWEPNAAFLKPLIALKEKGLDFKSHYVDVLDFRSRQNGAPSNAESRHCLEGEGPILVNGRAIISDSHFINLYLDDAFPEKSLQPSDAMGRWRIQAIGRFFGEVLAPAVSTLGCHAYLSPALKKRDRRDLDAYVVTLESLERRQAWRDAAADNYTTELIDDSRRKVSIAIKRIEDTLGASPWLVGDSYSLADIEAFSLTNGLGKLTPELVTEKTCPRMIAWLNKIRARPAVKAALAMSKSGKPDECYVPGPEHSRWG
jgi:glutathione S-transferase